MHEIFNKSLVIVQSKHTQEQNAHKFPVMINHGCDMIYRRNIYSTFSDDKMRTWFTFKLSRALHL